MLLLSWDRLMCARFKFVQYAAVCHYRPFMYVSGVPDWVKPCHRVLSVFKCFNVNLVFFKVYIIGA